MANSVRQSFFDIRREVQGAAPIVLLQIGEEQSCVAFGSQMEPEQVLILEIGASRTSREFFKHNPPTPLELETAIMTVEDEVIRVHLLTLARLPLYSADQSILDMSKLIGYSARSVKQLALAEVEDIFNQLAARSEGRTASQASFPDDPRLAAALLILREFMHHLLFETIQLKAR
jgi:exopolyphosphatase/pppGpp-phosphohydrolase